MKKLLSGAVLSALLFTTAALADSVLIVHDGYEQTAAKVGSRITNAGHTVTELNINDTAESTIDLSTYDQVWDLRYNPMATETIAKYDTFVDAGGFLYLVTENPGCCGARNTQVGTLISNMGGGDNLTIGGSAGMTSNTITQVNATYMTALGDSGSIDLAAASAIENYGDGQWLIKDANDKVAGVMWVGNAGNLADGYTGTVITIADINWFDNDNRFTDNNIQAVDDLLNGVVAGTVEGTINESGTGTGVGSGAPAVTVTGTEAGANIVVVTTADGGTLTTIVTNHDVSETTTEQTVESTTTTTIATATDTTTCTTTTTITNYSDGSQSDAVSNNDESCATVTTTTSTSSDIVEIFTGSIDQTATAQDVTNANIRSLEFNGLNAMASDHKYDNGMTGTTRGFTLGGKKDLENGYTIGGGLAQFSTNINDADNNKAGASTTVLAGSIEKNNVEFGIRHGMTDYTASRNIGPYSNSMATSGKDTSASVMFKPETGNKLEPVIGYTRGKRTLDGYTEGGDALTSRTVAESSEMYGYGTVGGTLDFGLLDVTGLHHTDGVNNVSVGLEKESDTLNWELRVNRTMTVLGDTNSLSAGISWKF